MKRNILLKFSEENNDIELVDAVAFDADGFHQDIEISMCDKETKSEDGRYTFILKNNGRSDK